jgi:hypothetical protein
MRKGVRILIVKGDRFEATKAASEHKVPFAFMGELQHQNATIGHTSADAEALNRWYIETRNAPYPAGALLWWGERPKEKRD